MHVSGFMNVQIAANFLNPKQVIAVSSALTEVSPVRRFSWVKGVVVIKLRELMLVSIIS
jgi:hypothetical protein